MTIREHLEAIRDRHHEEWSPGVAANKQHATAALAILDNAECGHHPWASLAEGRYREVPDPERDA